MKIIFIGNQSANLVNSFYQKMSEFILDKRPIETIYLIWTEKEKIKLVQSGVKLNKVHSFEKFVNEENIKKNIGIDDIERKYSEIYWSKIVASERSFTDYSFLFGSSGERNEDAAYISELVKNLVLFFEEHFQPGDVLVTQTADTIYTLISLKLAQQLGLKSFSIAPAWLLENEKNGGGLLVNDEFLQSDKIIKNYKKRISSLGEFSISDQTRIERLRNSIEEFDGKTRYFEQTGKNSKSGLQALTPNFSSIWRYLNANHHREKKVEYNKISPTRKFKANLSRLIRAKRNKKYMGSKSIDVFPKKSVFFGLHFQPEQTTLVQGLWYSNQLALIENISKSLPLGYTLIVKEHPWGRSFRPTWQYKFINLFYNVEMCDASSKDIINHVEAVIAVSGTIAVESLVFGKPTIVLGKNTFTFCDAFYRPQSVSELPNLFKRILINKETNGQQFKKKVDSLLLAYLDSLIPAYPLIEYTDIWAEALINELNLNKTKI